MKLLSAAKTIFLIVKLVVPTDFEILEAMSDGQRQTAPNLAEMLDQRRQYMNDRLSHLASMGLVSKVGPSNRSGMYKITSKGLIALEFREQYEHEKASEFAKLIDEHQSKSDKESRRSQEYNIDEIQKELLYEYMELYTNNHQNDTNYIEKLLEELESRGLIKKKELNGEHYYSLS